MNKLCTFFLICGLVLSVQAKSTKNRRPAQAQKSTMQITCSFAGDKILDGAKIQLDNTKYKILSLNNKRTDIVLEVVGRGTNLRNKDTVAQNDCVPETFNSVDLMEVSIPYKGATVEGWLLCHTTGHGLSGDPRNCDSRDY